jgi:hypothetical protein
MADIGVNVDGVKRHEHQIGVDGGRRETENEDRQESEQPVHQRIDQVRPRAGEPIHVQARVMDRVEIPHPRNLVERAMHPIAHEVDAKQDLEELEDQRLRRDLLLESRT